MSNQTNKELVIALQNRVGVPADGIFGPATKAAMLKSLINLKAAKISDNNYQTAAGRLGCSSAQIKAFASVESNGSGYFPTGRPKILYEPHIFSKQTGGVYNIRYPRLSYPHQGEFPYPKTDKRYDQLADAAQLNLLAAFEACSWGKFQILGTNAKAIGYENAIEMAYSMVESEENQLVAFVKFISANHLQPKLIQMKPNNPTSCKPIARAYNGPAYRKNHYDVKLANALACYES